MRFVFLLLLSSACIFPVSNNGNRRNQDTFTSTSTSTTQCDHLTDADTGKVLRCIANDEIAYGCATMNECWYEAGNIRVDIGDCEDQRSIDSAVLDLQDVCGGLYVK